MVLVLLVCMIPSGLMFTLFCPGFEIKKALAAVGISCLWGGIIFAVQTPLINRRQRRLRVFVYEDKLVKQCGKKQQTLLWEDIEKIKMVEKKNGDVAAISLCPQKSKTVIYLVWFCGDGRFGRSHKRKYSRQSFSPTETLEIGLAESLCGRACERGTDNRRNVHYCFDGSHSRKHIRISLCPVTRPGTINIPAADKIRCIEQVV
jgi:hypothetical protein